MVVNACKPSKRLFHSWEKQKKHSSHLESWKEKTGREEAVWRERRDPKESGLMVEPSIPTLHTVTHASEKDQVKKN